MNSDTPIPEWEQWLDLCSPELKQTQISMSRPKQIEVPAWHLLLIPDDDEARHLRFDSFEEMRGAISELEALDCYAIYPFFGMRCQLNRAQGGVELYYLRHPDGGLHPLFESQPGVVEIADGHFGGDEMPVGDRPTGARRLGEEVEEEEVTVYEEVPVDDEPDADAEELADDEDALAPSTDGEESFP